MDSSSTNVPNASIPESNSSGGSTGSHRILGIRFYIAANPLVRGPSYTFVMNEAEAERLEMATHVQNGQITLFDDEPPFMIWALNDAESDREWKRLVPDPIKKLADRGLIQLNKEETEKKVVDEMKTFEEVVEQHPSLLEDDNSGGGGSGGSPPRAASN